MVMIRELDWNDMHDLISNYYTLYDEVKENRDLGIVLFNEKPSYESEIRWFADLYADVHSGNAVAVVAEEDSGVVGICDVHRLRPDSEVDHTGVLGIVIKKEYRGRGIGRKLMAEAISRCRGKFENLKLDVFTLNTRAISLYAKMGFKECGRISRSVKRNGRFIDELTMIRELTD